MNTAYQDFLDSKTLRAPKRGLSTVPGLSSHLFPFQQSSVAFGLEAGSWGCFLNTGLGKTRCELEWATHAAEATNGRALILTPLAVARQIEAEGAALGYQVRVIRDADATGEGVNICNYDRLHLLDPDAFGAVALDEASVLKNFTGATSRALIAAFSEHRFRMAATATPAPNDHAELGQHAAFCGLLSRDEMLVRWFINDSSDTKNWRLKGHAVTPFFDWLASWARTAEHPRDLGDDVPGFDLPPMTIIRHRAEEPETPITGGLFGGDVSATSIHDVKRQTSDARARVVVDVVERDWSCTSVGSVDKLAACGSLNTPPNDARNTNQIQLNAKSASLRADTRAATCATTTSRTSHDGRPTAERTPTPSTRGGESDTQLTPSSENYLSQRSKSGAGETETNGSTASSANSVSPSSNTTSCSPSSEASAPSAEATGSTAGEKLSPSITAIPQGESEGFFAARATSESVASRTTQIDSLEPWLIFCDTDYEQDTLERLFTARFGERSFLSVRGSQSADIKEQLIFRWLDRERPILISKPSIVGYGMNFQFCARIAFIGRSFSYESWYQAVRRCWRFGQTRPVQVHLVVAEGEDTIARVIDRKADDHAALLVQMRAAMARAIGRSSERRIPYEPTHAGHLPAWMERTA